MKALILFVFTVLLIVAEHEVIPGRPIPAECHAEAHTDYDGLAVRWGLTHHVASAADCCQACLDQAKNAKDAEKKCNIWVYCAEENGCYSPDKYEHKNHECWLKQVSSCLLQKEIAFIRHVLFKHQAYATTFGCKMVQCLPKMNASIVILRINTKSHCLGYPNSHCSIPAQN